MDRSCAVCGFPAEVERTYWVTLADHNGTGLIPMYLRPPGGAMTSRRCIYPDCRESVAQEATDWYCEKHARLLDLDTTPPR